MEKRENEKNKKMMIGKRLKCGLLAGMLFASRLAGGQAVSPGVPDFTNLTAPWVTATYGFTENPFLNRGIVGNRHQVITFQGKDYYTGGVLNFLPPGEGKVVKLGNENWGNEAESITYRFIVDADRPVLFLKFAVVFEDPKHPLVDQPRFVVRIMDKDGNLVESCAEYDVSAREGIEGFQTSRLYNWILWRNWTNVGLDMSARAGEEIQVQFITYDCKRWGHFGYAYFTASCISRDLAMTGCNGKEFTVKAPEGFASYLWQDGQTTPSVTKVQTGEAMDLACEVTSATGCCFTLSAHITPEPVVPPRPEIYDTICVGDAYTRHNYDLPSQTETGTFKFSNSYLNLSDCGNSGKTNLHLTVLPRYYPVEAAICPGEDYTEGGFSILQPEPGVHFDTLRLSSPTHPCDSIVTLKLTVYPRLSTGHEIVGESTLCAGAQAVYSIDEDWEDGLVSWTFPAGFYPLSGMRTTRVKVQATSEAESGNIIVRYGRGDCSFSPAPLRVTVHPAYWEVHSDSICTGSEYHGYGFDVPRQDTAGYRIFSHTYTTQQGCDSVVTLNLHVFSTPQLRIVSTDSVLCAGEEVTLQAWSGKGPFVVPPAVTVGDIYCTDGSVVKLEDYPASGKTAEGVVFHVDESGEHGWIVHLTDQSASCRWLDEGLELPELSWTDGAENTRLLREKSTPANDVSVFVVDFDNGWYLPALGQLGRLYANLPVVNKSLNSVSGGVFDVGEDWGYWSSYGAFGAWGFCLENPGTQVWRENVTQRRVRSVRSF